MDLKTAIMMALMPKGKYDPYQGVEPTDANLERRFGALASGDEVDPAFVNVKGMLPEGMEPPPDLNGMFGAGVDMGDGTSQQLPTPPPSGLREMIMRRMLPEPVNYGGDDIERGLTSKALRAGQERRLLQRILAEQANKPARHQRVR